MRSHIYLRPARDTEGQQFLEWSRANSEHGAFDPMVATYPSTVTWAIYDKSGVLGYMPVQTPLMLDSFAPRPGLSDFDKARCFKEITQEMVTQAHIKGVGEIYFLGTDEDTNTLAANQVFEELPYKVFRLKVRETE